MRKQTFALAAALALSLSGCGYNSFQTNDEQIKASWSEGVNQYQRRADLAPNLVNTVKGEAKFEQDTLTKVIEARSKATSIQATPELVNNPEAFQKFQQAQGQSYNVTVRSFPSNLTAMVFGYQEKPNFSVENEKEISKPPSIAFDGTSAKTASPAATGVK